MLFLTSLSSNIPSNWPPPHIVAARDMHNNTPQHLGLDNEDLDHQSAGANNGQGQPLRLLNNTPQHTPPHLDLEDGELPPELHEEDSDVQKVLNNIYSHDKEPNSFGPHDSMGTSAELASFEGSSDLASYLGGCETDSVGTINQLDPIKLGKEIDSYTEEEIAAIDVSDLVSEEAQFMYAMAISKYETHRQSTALWMSSDTAHSPESESRNQDEVDGNRSVVKSDDMELCDDQHLPGENRMAGDLSTNASQLTGLSPQSPSDKPLISPSGVISIGKCKKCNFNHKSPDGQCIVCRGANLDLVIPTSNEDLGTLSDRPIVIDQTKPTDIDMSRSKSLVSVDIKRKVVPMQNSNNVSLCKKVLLDKSYNEKISENLVNIKSPSSGEDSKSLNVNISNTNSAFINVDEKMFSKLSPKVNGVKKTEAVALGSSLKTRLNMGESQYSPGKVAISDHVVPNISPSPGSRKDQYAASTSKTSNLVRTKDYSRLRSPKASPKKRPKCHVTPQSVKKLLPEFDKNTPVHNENSSSAPLEVRVEDMAMLQKHTENPLSPHTTLAPLPSPVSAQSSPLLSSMPPSPKLIADPPLELFSSTPNASLNPPHSLETHTSSTSTSSTVFQKISETTKPCGVLSVETSLANQMTDKSSTPSHKSKAMRNLAGTFGSPEEKENKSLPEEKSQRNKRLEYIEVMLLSVIP